MQEPGHLAHCLARSPNWQERFSSVDLRPSAWPSLLLRLLPLVLVAWFAGAATTFASGLFQLDCPQLVHESLPWDQHPQLARILYRELGRQAVLLAAREEFGCRTRDAALYEPLSSEASDPLERVFKIQVATRHGVGMHVTLRLEDAVVWEAEVKESIGPVNDVRSLATKLESLTRGELADALAAAGLERRAAPAVQDAPVPAQAVELSLQMDGISQFRALRLVHAAVQKSGESLPRTAALARIYAHLAVLHNSTLDARGVAYRARAMLYAERALQQDPNDPFPLWNRAYVYATIGWPTAALEDLKAAKQSNATNAAAPPEWVSLIEDYCHYRHPRLEAVALDEGSQLGQLAAVFWFRSALNSGSQAITLETGKRALAMAPGCLWLVDGMHGAAGVAYQHLTTMLAPAQHAKLLQSTLPEAEEIPEEVRKDLRGLFPLRNSRQIAEIGRTLVNAAADDDAEPSLAMLGQDIDAQNVLHIARRGYFLRYALTTDASEFIETIEEALDGNAWAPVIRTLGLPISASTAAYTRLLQESSVREGNYLSAYELCWSLPQDASFKDMSAKDVQNLLNAAAGGTEFDYVKRLQNAGNVEWRVTQAKWMADCSVHCPLRISILIRDDYAGSEPYLEEWQEAYGSHPSIAAALGEAFAAQGDYQRAIPLYERSLAAAADYKVIEKLADAHFQLDDDKAWLATMQRAFDVEDYSLSHARAAASIAATLMHQGKYADALPWAEKASESGAGWAWTLEIQCRTALGQYEQAENLARQNSARYPTDAWYCFCFETGHGDLKAAWKDAQEFYRTQRNVDRQGLAYFTANYLWASGQKAECLSMLEEQLQQEFWVEFAMMAYTIAGEIGDQESRTRWEQALTADTADDPQGNPGESPYPLLLRRWKSLDLASCSGADVSAALEEIRERWKDTGDWRFRLAYYTGVELSTAGRQKEAIEQFEVCVRAGDEQARDAYMLASRRMRELGGDPAKVSRRNYHRQFVRRTPELQQTDEN